MLGRAKCKILKEIRQKIADENDIPYVTRECTYQGDCSGTCPRCESELRYLERELAARQRIGKQVAVTALCAGLALGAAGCNEVIPDGGGQDLAGAPMEDPIPTPVIQPEELAGAPEIWDEGDYEASQGEATPTAEGAFDGLASFATTFNVDGVSNGAHYCPLFTPESDVTLRALTTYHWNSGSGAVPGAIRIYDVTDGGEELLGTWDATTRGGSGAQNVYWDIFPDITLEAGHVYHIIDSGATTWSSNSTSESMGFVDLFTDEGACEGVCGTFSPCDELQASDASA